MLGFTTGILFLFVLPLGMLKISELLTGIGVQLRHGIITILASLALVALLQGQERIIAQTPTERRLETMDDRQRVLEGAFREITQIQKNQDGTNSRLEAMIARHDERFAKQDERVDQIEKSLNAMQTTGETMVNTLRWSAGLITFMIGISAWWVNKKKDMHERGILSLQSRLETIEVTRRRRKPQQ